MNEQTEQTEQKGSQRLPRIPVRSFVPFPVSKFFESTPTPPTNRHTIAAFARVVRLREGPRAGHRDEGRNEHAGDEPDRGAQPGVWGGAQPETRGLHAGEAAGSGE